jgi:hypothetical protein
MTCHRESELLHAQLRKLVHHAPALPVARRDPMSVIQSDFADAFEKVLLGRPEEFPLVGALAPNRL